MISDRNRGVQQLVLISQCILVTVAFWIWLFLCYYLPIDRDVIARYIVYNEFVLLGLLVGSRPWRPNVGLHLPGFEETNRRSFRQLGATLFYLLIYLVAARDERISRGFLFSFIPLLYLILFFTNRRLPALIGRLTFRQGQEQKVILVGPEPKALAVRQWLDQNKHLGVEVLGLLTDPAPPSSDFSLQPSTFTPEKPSSALRPPPSEPHLPILGRPDDLEKFLSAPGLMKVIMVEFPRANGTMRHYTQLCEARGVRLLVVADIDQIFGHPVAVFEDQGLCLISLREEPLEDPVNRFFKRCLDIAVSVPVLGLVLPFCGFLVWCMQRLQSPGPLFFLQPRPGFQNRPFNIYKFRTLHVNNPNVNQLPSADDPRVYPAGRIFRKLSVDELPQFLNVLRGEMSVVGPRPHLMVDNERFPRLFNKAYVRAYVKPGITGLAQARGHRGAAETPEEVAIRMKSDIEYLENWSFGLDCWLILRTALQMVIPPKSAV